MLKDKVAIITDASYGMGQTMAELFAEEGTKVLLTAGKQPDGAINMQMNIHSFLKSLPLHDRVKKRRIYRRLSLALTKVPIYCKIIYINEKGSGHYALFLPDNR